MIGTRIGTEKSVWQRYGKLLLTVLVGAAVVYGGLQYYTHYQSQETIKASAIYDKMIVGMRKNDKTQAKSEAETLTKHYAKTPYGPLAALLLAKMNIDENQLEEAANNLKIAMQSDKQGPVHQIASVRLARVMAAQEKYTEALNLLSPSKIPDGYGTLFEETKGDIYMMQNQKDKAKEAYKAAQLAAPPGAPVVRLQLKQTDLGNN